LVNTARQIQTATDYLKESPWLWEKKVSILLTSVFAGKVNFNTLEKKLFTIVRDTGEDRFSFESMILKRNIK